MFNDGPGMGFGPFAHILMTILSGIAFLVTFAIVAGLLFLLVRFLLVATHAAQIYVAKNRPATPTTPAASTTPAATTPAATKPVVVAPAKPATAPATKPRTPKTPPAV